MLKSDLPVVHTAALAFKDPFRKPTIPLDGHQASHGSRWHCSPTYLHWVLMNWQLVRYRQQLGCDCTPRHDVYQKVHQRVFPMERQLGLTHLQAVEILASNLTPPSIVSSESNKAEHAGIGDDEEPQKPKWTRTPVIPSLSLKRELYTCTQYRL